MSMVPWVSYRPGTWLIDECQISFFMSCLMGFGPTFFVVIFNVICLTINNLSGILDTTDTSFVHPWRGVRKKTKKSQIQIRTFENRWGGSQFFKNVSIISYSQTPS